MPWKPEVMWEGDRNFWTCCWSTLQAVGDLLELKDRTTEEASVSSGMVLNGLLAEWKSCCRALSFWQRRRWKDDKMAPGVTRIEKELSWNMEVTCRCVTQRKESVKRMNLKNNWWNKVSRRWEVVRYEGGGEISLRERRNTSLSEKGGICEGIEEFGDIVSSYQLTLILLMICWDLGHRDESLRTVEKIWNGWIMSSGGGPGVSSLFTMGYMPVCLKIGVTGCRN